MSNTKESDEKKSPKENYESFVGFMGALGKARNASQAIKSPDVNERMGARDVALGFTKSIPGFEAMSKDPNAVDEFLKSDYKVDGVIQQATAYSLNQATDLFTKNKEDVISQTPDKGLAKIVLDYIPAQDMKGNRDYEDASKAHSAYQGLKNVKDEDGNINHDKVYNVVMQHVAGEAKNDNLVKAAQYILVNNPRAALNVLNNVAKKYATKFDSYLPGDESKAKYARELLNKAEPKIAMDAIMNASLNSKDKKK